MHNIIWPTFRILCLFYMYIFSSTCDLPWDSLQFKNKTVNISIYQRFVKPGFVLECEWIPLTAILNHSPFLFVLLWNKKKAVSIIIYHVFYKGYYRFLKDIELFAFFTEAVRGLNRIKLSFMTEISRCWFNNLARWRRRWRKQENETMETVGGQEGDIWGHWCQGQRNGPQNGSLMGIMANEFCLLEHEYVICNIVGEDDMFMQARRIT